MDNSLVLAIRSAGMPRDDELRLVELVEEYGRKCHKDGYTSGYIEATKVARSDRP